MKGSLKIGKRHPKRMAVSFPEYTAISVRHTLGDGQFF